MANNISTKVNLSALQGAAIIKSGKNKDVDCILIPIEINHLFKSDKGAVYLDMIAFETDPAKRREGSKDTHMVKQSLPKEVREKQTDEEKRAMPILGNMIVWGADGSGSAETGAKVAASENDLPF